MPDSSTSPPTRPGAETAAEALLSAAPARSTAQARDTGTLLFSPSTTHIAPGTGAPHAAHSPGPAPSHTVAEAGGSRFRDVLRTGAGELLLFAVTPPRLSTDPAKVPEIAARTLERLDGLTLDALLLYDLADESARTDVERPFPFTETWDPALYLRDHLQDWTGQTIVYRAVGKYSPEEITRFLHEADERVATVFVGAASREQQVQTSLRTAYELYRKAGVDVPLGAVAIPERHAGRGDEQSRLFAKQQEGASYFITQVVYDLRFAKDLASDYAYAMRETHPGEPMAPLIFSLSVCGSSKSLEFLQWLGVNVPRWVRNELLHAANPLAMSASYSAAAARELIRFCRYLDIPFGFSIESVSNRRVEIEASVDLAREVASHLDRSPRRAGHPG